MTNLYVLHRQVQRDKLAKLVNASIAKVGSDWYFINFTLERPDIFKGPKTETLSAWHIVTTGGRLFGPKAEVKWQLNGKDSFDLWTLQEESAFDPCPNLIEEAAPRQPEGDNGEHEAAAPNPVLTVSPSPPFERVDSKPTKFYCIGAWDGTSFREGRLPNSIGYPFSGNAKGNRVFFKAMEYSPLPPQRDDKTQNDAKELQKIMDALNQPRVLAYRLIGMGVDHGERKPDFADRGD